MFIGYSLSQSAYLYIDLITNKIGISHPVTFIESTFQYSMPFLSFSSPESWFSKTPIPCNIASPPPLNIYLSSSSPQGPIKTLSTTNGIRNHMDSTLVNSLQVLIQRLCAPHSYSYTIHCSTFSYASKKSYKP